MPVGTGSPGHRVMLSSPREARAVVSRMSCADLRRTPRPAPRRCGTRAPSFRWDRRVRSSGSSCGGRAMRLGRRGGCLASWFPRHARAVVRTLVLAAAAGAGSDAVAQDGVAGDRAALVTLYNETGGPDWIGPHELDLRRTDRRVARRDDRRGRPGHGARAARERARGNAPGGPPQPHPTPPARPRRQPARRVDSGRAGRPDRARGAVALERRRPPRSRRRRPDRRDSGRAGQPRQPRAAGSPRERPDRSDPARAGRADPPPRAPPRAKRAHRGDSGRAGQPDPPPPARPRPQPAGRAGARLAGAPDPPEPSWSSAATTSRRGRCPRGWAACAASRPCRSRAPT